MRRRKGLTLIELLIVVLILAALAAIAVPRITQSATTAKINACDTNVDTVNTQLELYYADDGSYPTLTTLFTDPNYFPDGTPECPYDGSPYVLNPDDRVIDHDH